MKLMSLYFVTARTLQMGEFHCAHKVIMLHSLQDILLQLESNSPPASRHSVSKYEW